MFATTPAVRAARQIVSRSAVLRSAVNSVAPKAAATAATASSRCAFHSVAVQTNASILTIRPSTESSFQVEARRSVFIQTENTPNPESLKFVPTDTVVLETPEDGSTNGFYVTHSDSKTEINRSPLAKNLFKIEGVKSVYLGADFVTVTKFAQNKWQLMRPDIFSTLMDFFDSKQLALLDQAEITDTTILDDDDEIVAMIKELMEARIRPAVQEDGGDIRYISFEEETGMVTVQLAGSCVGCPSSSVTLKQGVENMLMHYIPEVTSVIALEEEEDEEDEGPASEVKVESTETVKKEKSYEERLAAAGIPFSE